MAYQTGTANSAAALKSAFEAFLAGSGFAVSGGIASKGGSNIRLTDLSAAGDQVLRIEGANNATFTAGVCAHGARLVVPDTYWPATYHFFAHANPDTAFCIVNYNVNYHQHLCFGEIVKLHAGAFVGGNFFSGTWGDSGYFSFTFRPETVGSFSGTKFNAPFYHGTAGAACANFLHAEIDGTVWPGENDGSYVNRPLFSLHASPLLARGVSAWNQQAILLPFHLWLGRPSAPSTYSYLGYMAHCRALRLLNYNPGDIVTLGADRWKVFPFYAKDSANPDNSANMSGVYGWAIRYDGP